MVPGFCQPRAICASSPAGFFIPLFAPRTTAEPLFSISPSSCPPRNAAALPRLPELARSVHRWRGLLALVLAARLPQHSPVLDPRMRRHLKGGDASQVNILNEQIFTFVAASCPTTRGSITNDLLLRYIYLLRRAILALLEWYARGLCASLLLACPVRPAPLT